MKTLAFMLALSYTLPNGGGITELVQEPSRQACFIAKTLTLAAMYNAGIKGFDLRCISHR